MSIALICEICRKKEVTKLCDYAVGSGVVTSRDFQELPETCDKQMCSECATNVWFNCELCPEHANEVRSMLIAKTLETP
jgi:hypothetical protein